MNINHLALWTDDIELLKDFYVRHFNATPEIRYCNPLKNFTSYFLKFPDGGATLEIMNMPGITDRNVNDKLKGLCHFAISTDSPDKVDELTGMLRASGICILNEPRTTGDGCYESVISDPDGNIVELTV